MTILTASPGCVYSNGQAYGPTVCLPDGADKAEWKEISQERAEREAEARPAPAKARKATPPERLRVGIPARGTEAADE